MCRPAWGAYPFVQEVTPCIRELVEQQSSWWHLYHAPPFSGDPMGTLLLVKRDEHITLVHPGFVSRQFDDSESNCQTTMASGLLSVQVCGGMCSIEAAAMPLG